MKKIILSGLLIISASVCASELSSADLEQNLKESFVKEINLIGKKKLYSPSFIAYYHSLRVDEVCRLLQGSIGRRMAPGTPPRKILVSVTGEDIQGGKMPICRIDGWTEIDFKQTFAAYDRLCEFKNRK